MKPYDAALAILTERDTLDAQTIKNAVTAALLAASADLPVDVTRINVTVSKRAKKRLGQCRYKRFRADNGGFEVRPFEINVSLAGAALASREDLADTIAHEVAHAALDYEVGHEQEWKDLAARYGATPAACGGGDGIERSYRFAYYCPSCEKVIGRQAGRPRKRRRCYCSALVTTVDLKTRMILPGHSVRVEGRAASEMFTEVMHLTIADYEAATEAVLTLARTA